MMNSVIQASECMLCMCWWSYQAISSIAYAEHVHDLLQTDCWEFVCTFDHSLHWYHSCHRSAYAQHELNMYLHQNINDWHYENRIWSNCMCSVYVELMLQNIHRNCSQQWHLKLCIVSICIMTVIWNEVHMSLFTLYSHLLIYAQAQYMQNTCANQLTRRNSVCIFIQNWILLRVSLCHTYVMWILIMMIFKCTWIHHTCNSRIVKVCSCQNHL